MLFYAIISLTGRDEKYDKRKPATGGMLPRYLRYGRYPRLIRGGKITLLRVFLLMDYK